MRILVVEDEPLVALDVADTLQRAGCEVMGTRRTVDAALRAIMSDPPDVVFLDFNLGREDSIRVADVLDRSQIPFIWVTGYPRDTIPIKHRDRPWVAKPFRTEALLGALGGACASELHV